MQQYPMLQTKLYIPPIRPELVSRPRLIERLNEGLHHTPGVTLISAPAGFGKTTLVSEWVAGGERPAAWLSLDEGDNDLTRFLTCVIAALQTLAPHIGEGVLAVLQSPQPPSSELLVTTLLNEITAVLKSFTLVLDDYHVIDAQPVDNAFAFLVEHLPPKMHLVIATREDPHLPLARLRARGQLTELRAAELRFAPAEAAEFLNRVMGLNLSAEEIAALETRTEGWIAGLQMAALSMQGRSDTASFIQAFTGSHRFVLDYLMEEVLQQQSAGIQAFLLRTSILGRLCGPLCDAVLLTPSGSGQGILEHLERANLFIVPLDNERRWYRYHHLFAGFLRQRLQQSAASSAEGEMDVAELHVRASQWHEDNGLAFEAFRHATAANDVERAERLIESGGMPLHLLGVVTVVLDWLASLPKTVPDARPLLWVRQATLLLVIGQTTGVEEKLQAAEAALAAAPQGAEPDDKARDLVGQIAAARATLALTRYDAETMIAQSRRALEYLQPDNLSFRTAAIWTLANAYTMLGDRAAAGRAYAETVSITQASGSIFFTMLATSGLGEMQELENQLYPAAETYRRVLQLCGDHPLPNACEAHLGLARICYEWNDLETAEQHGQQGLRLAQQYDSVIDRFVICEVFLARLKLAQGDLAGAAAMLAQAEQSVRQHNFVQRMPEVAAAQALVSLRQGNVAEAAHLAEKYELPISQARVLLAQGDAPAALAMLEPLRQQAEAKGWQDERLKVMVLQAVALHAHGEKEKAVQVLGDALALAESGGFIRTFVDEGPPMARLIREPLSRGIAPDYARRLLEAFSMAGPEQRDRSKPRIPESEWCEPLSERELEVLQLIAEGLTNQEIANRLYLSLNTVKVHTRNIYSKLDAHHRADAIARARVGGILPD